MNVDLKISAMTSATDLLGDELVPVVQAGENRKATVAQLLIGQQDTYRQVKSVYYDQWYLAGCRLATSEFGVISISADNLYFMPFVEMLPRKLTGLALNCSVTGPSGTMVRFGIYDTVSQDDLLPAALLLDAGEADSTDNPLVKVACNFQIVPGKMYYIAIVANNDIEIIRVPQIACLPIWGFDGELSHPSSAARGYQSYGPLPDPAPISVGSWEGTLGYLPRLAYQLSLPSHTLIDDELVDTNGTALESHTISPTNVPASSWVSDLGAMEIQSNEVVQTSSAYGVYTVDAGIADAIVKVRLSYGGSAHDSYGGITFRTTDYLNRWFIGQYDASHLALMKFEAGSFAVVQSAVWGNSQGVDYELSVKLEGDKITAYVDGVQILEETGTTFNVTETKHGFHGYYSAGVYEQHFKQLTIDEL